MLVSVTKLPKRGLDAWDLLRQILKALHVSDKSADEDGIFQGGRRTGRAIGKLGLYLGTKPKRSRGIQWKASGHIFLRLTPSVLFPSFLLFL
jgi:hypothetical protein